MDKGAQHDALKLQDEVAKQYDVKPGKVRKFYSVKFGMVDLNKVNLSQAKALEQAGILVKKAETKSLKADTK